MTQDTNPVPEADTESVLADMDTIEVTPDEATLVPTEADEIKRLTEALARSQADYQNLLMRVERDKADMVFFLSGKILSPLLAQIDNLTRAVALKAGTEGDTFVDGLRSVLAGFDRYLESQGVRSFASLGAEVVPCQEMRARSSKSSSEDTHSGIAYSVMRRWLWGVATNTII